MILRIFLVQMRVEVWWGRRIYRSWVIVGSTIPSASKWVSALGRWESIISLLSMRNIVKIIRRNISSTGKEIRTAVVRLRAMLPVYRWWYFLLWRQVSSSWDRTTVWVRRRIRTSKGIWALRRRSWKSSSCIGRRQKCIAE